MLATPARSCVAPGWAVEPKLDGWRAIVEVGERVAIHTRTGRDITDRLPELQAVRSAVDGRSVTVNGELIIGQGLPGDFYRLGLGWPLGTAGGVTFAAFDLLEADGRSLRGEVRRLAQGEGAHLAD